jgi:hypothetical protein
MSKELAMHVGSKRDKIATNLIPEDFQETESSARFR